MLMWSYPLETARCYTCTVCHIFHFLCEHREFIWLYFHKFPSFNNIINSKGSRIVGEKLVRRAIPCRLCFWPAVRERLPTPALNSPVYSTLNAIVTSYNIQVFDVSLA